MSDYFNIHDGMMRGMTFEDASLILRNVNRPLGADEKGAARLDQ